MRRSSGNGRYTESRRAHQQRAIVVEREGGDRGWILGQGAQAALGSAVPDIYHPVAAAGGKRAKRGVEGCECVSSLRLRAAR